MWNPSLVLSILENIPILLPRHPLSESPYVFFRPNFYTEINVFSFTFITREETGGWEEKERENNIYNRHFNLICKVIVSR